MKKPRFDYNNPETCYLALTYILEHDKCPECLTIINPQLTNEDADILVLKVECSNCGLTFEYGTTVDNHMLNQELKKGAYNHPSLIAIDEIKGTGKPKKTAKGVKNGKLR